VPEILPEPLTTIARTFGAPGLTLRDHGPRHWKCVALTGLRLAELDPAIDMGVVYAFAQLHDSQRLNEYGDPEHGPRAADVTLEAIEGAGLPRFEPNSERAGRLLYAIREHTAAGCSEDPTIGACWDADRLNLWRVGIEPAIRFMSTRPAREHFDELSEWAMELIEGPEPTWANVARACRPTAGPDVEPLAP